MKLDLDKLKEKMGNAAFYSMEAEYCKWMEETKIRGREGHHIVMGNDGKAHSCTSWEVEYPNAGPEKHEMFVRAYLADYCMESMLEGIEDSDG